MQMMTFVQWKAEVEKLLVRKYGLGCDDLADAPYWDSWDDGIAPDEMVEIVEAYNDIC